MSDEPDTLTSPGRRGWLLLAPLGVVVAGGLAFRSMLHGLKDGSFDPRGIPSPMIGKPVPAFSLPLQPRPGAAPATLDSSSLTSLQRPILINFFASWCVPCVEEAPALAALRGSGVPIVGIAYKDRVDATARFLATNGDPYSRLARDEAGQIAIDFGVFGVPETYVVDRGGIIRARFAGAVTDEIADGAIRPMLRSLA